MSYIIEKEQTRYIDTCVKYVELMYENKLISSIIDLFFSMKWLKNKRQNKTKQKIGL